MKQTRQAESVYSRLIFIIALMLPFHQLLPKQENTEKRLLNRSVTQSVLREEKLLYHYCTFISGMTDTYATNEYNRIIK